MDPYVNRATYPSGYEEECTYEIIENDDGALVPMCLVHERTTVHLDPKWHHRPCLAVDELGKAARPVYNRPSTVPERPSESLWARVPKLVWVHLLLVLVWLISILLYLGVS